MSKVFLYLAALLLLAFVVSRQFSEPPTWAPFVNGCVSSGASVEQCECLSNYVHDRLTEEEVRAVMSNQVVGSAFEQKVETVVQAGTQACR